MGALTKGQFLQPKDRKTEKFVMPEWGEDAYVVLRQISSKELIGLQRMHGTAIDDTDETHADFLFALVLLSVFDDDGKPLFSETDKDLLQQKSFNLLKQLANACITLNNLEADDEDDDAKKNSQATS